jgi:ATP-dependent protease Clp ATPase subunit
MFNRILACSFCRRSAAEVAKLVAGPRVYICDRCAAEVVRIMNDSLPTEAVPKASSGASLRAILERIQNSSRRGIRRNLPELRTSGYVTFRA